MRRHQGLLFALLLSACSSSSQDALDPPTTGGLRVAVAGLPAGTSAGITVTGPGDYSRALTAGGDLDELVPGTYAVAAAPVLDVATIYQPTAASQAVQVASGRIGQ